MSCYLYKLRFTTPLHAGESRLANGLESAQSNLFADTLFSALCHAALQLDGPDALDALVEKARAGKLLFSDTFPYKEDTLYLPRPVMPSRSERETDVSKRKLMKKLAFLPAELLEPFLASISGQGVFEPERVSNDFSVSTLDTKVNLTSGPFSVAGVCFHDGCGLYGIVQADPAEMEYVTKLLTLLGLGGVGGKTSSGYGKFELTEAAPLSECGGQGKLICRLLKNTAADYFLSLTAALPQDAELERALDGATYRLIRRGGFLYSEKTERPLKKQTQYCFAAGSVFRTRFAGDVYNVAPHAPHPAYRYLKPLFLGVSCP